MATKYNNGVIPALGDDVVLVAGDNATYAHGKVLAIQGNNIRIDSLAVYVPAFNAIRVSDAHAASTTGIVATTPNKK
jgi:hypothetical protein